MSANLIILKFIGSQSKKGQYFLKLYRQKSIDSN